MATNSHKHLNWKYKQENLKTTQHVNLNLNQMEEKIKQLIAELKEREQLLKFSSSPFDTFRRRELTDVIERLNNILKGE